MAEGLLCKFVDHSMKRAQYTCRRQKMTLCTPEKNEARAANTGLKRRQAMRAFQTCGTKARKRFTAEDSQIKMSLFQ